jgi:cyclophilin family peptidyl-prolyl cis-trans isomerase/HEAT repeat protein
MKKIIFAYLLIAICFSAFVAAQIPVKTLVQISRAEDELRFDKTLEDLMKNTDPNIRRRAALAAGRIGNEAAIPTLINLLENDKDEMVQTMAAFAIGEIESIEGADAILKILNVSRGNPQIRARAIEAAGKIAAANAKDEKSKALGEAILAVLSFENRKRSGPYLNVIELGLTAALRARPADAEKILVEYTDAYTPQIRANTLNALTRLRAKNANEQARKLLQKDTDAIVRANAARVLGAAEDNEAFDLLLNAATNDKDSRVRVSAIRALGSLKDERAADKLLERGEKLLADYKKSKFANPVEKSKMLEIAAALGRILPNTNNERAIKFLDDFRYSDNYESPEIEIAFAQVSPKSYMEAVPRSENTEADFWKQVVSTSQGMAEFSKLADKGQSIDPSQKPEQILAGFIYFAETPERKSDIIRAIPDIIRAYASYKTDDLPEILREYLKHKDIFIRATAAELLGEQTATKENIEALKTAFAESLKTDKDYNDAQLAILSALVKLDKPQSFESLRLALTAPDYLVRKHAANLIKQNDLSKDFSNIEKMVGTVKSYDAKTGTKLGQILNTEADYRRAVSRKNGTVKAILTTEKGKFTIDLLPEDAPLTVDNFIKLARSNYFNGVAVHRVVPNFVMQDGDPRGDGNGGPGYSIRDEMNMIPYERGAVGMALSGKDTGGSQWFVTHSPQPHLDGGYTVFGRVNETDMKIVDSIVRGDKILKVEIIESGLRKNIKAKK